jgi:hypothetical protein
MARRARAVIADANERARAALMATSSRATGIGALAWWDGEVGWRRPAAEVQAACAAAGLDPASTLPAVPDYKVAFGRAVDSVRAKIRTQDYTLIDAAPGPKGERRVAIVKVERNGRVSTTDEGTVVCPVSGEDAPYVERSHRFASEIVSLTKGTYHDVYTSDDVRTAIVQLIDRWRGMPCRQQPPKVVYWIPGPSVETIGQLADFAAAIGWGTVSLFVGQEGDKRSEAAVTVAVNNGLEAMLNEFSDEADKYCSADPSKTRPSTIANMLADAKALQDRWHMMRNVLGAAVKSGDARISKIEAKLTNRLGQVEAAREKALAKSA